jgi:signal transduction histidine kinase
MRRSSPPGGNVTIQQSDAEDARAFIAITVRATGIGMPPDKVEWVFEPFVQMAGAAAGQTDGVGLGLAISRRLARGMGGYLLALSTPGVGFSFTLTLPRC